MQPAGEFHADAAPDSLQSVSATQRVRAYVVSRFRVDLIQEVNDTAQTHTCAVSL